MQARVLGFTTALVLIARIAFAAGPQPYATPLISSTDALVGGTFEFCVTIENQGTPAPATGLGLFLDLRMPLTVSNPCDGIHFISAVVISTNPPVPLTPLHASSPCTSPNPVNHPLPPVPPTWLVNTGTNTGMQLVTLTLPFGSYQNTQPKIRVKVTASVDPSAVANTALPDILVRGGFRWGNGSGGAIVQTTGAVLIHNDRWEPLTVTPRVLILHSAYSGTDNETVPGPNGPPQQFTVTGDVAPGAILNGLQIKDLPCLSAGGIWSGPVTVLPTPATVTGLGTPCLTVDWGTTNVTSSQPPSITSAVYFDATTLANACSLAVTNTATVTQGTWQQAPSVLLTATSPATTMIAVRRLMAGKVPHPGPTIPGSTITFDINFRASDFDQLTAIVLKDTMSDGLQLTSAAVTMSDHLNGTRTLAIVPAATSNNVPFKFKCPPPANATCAAMNSLPPSTIPSTQYRFDISAALANASLNGSLTGGWYNGGTSLVPAQGTLTITAKVLDTFLYLSGKNLVKDDPLLNRAEISGLVSGSLMTCTDDGYSCLAVPNDILTKEIPAKNLTAGTWPQLGGPPATVGDNLTFHMWKTILSGDFAFMSLQDFFPGPLIHAANPGTTNCSSVPPPYSPAANCYSAGFPLVNTTGPASDNSIKWDFGSNSNPPNTPLSLDLYTTQKINNTPYPDGLLMTNETQECEKNSYGTEFCQDAIAQFTVQEPYLTIEKGVCGGNCPPPVSTCPVCPIPSFTATASVGPKMTYADAGDTVWFTVKLVNSGSGPNGAFDVQVTDTLVGFPGTIDYTNFTCIKRGDGTPVPWSFVTQSPTSFTISLTDATHPLLGTSGSTGSNVIIMVFPVVLNAAKFVTIGCYDNDAHIEHYANELGGPDFVLAGIVGSDDHASVCVKPHGLVKSLLSSSEPDPPAGSITIGNVETFNLHFIVPQAFNVFTVIDSLPGMQMIGSAVVTANGFTLPPSSWSVSGTAAAPHFDFSFKNFSSGGCQTIDIAFRALVMNSNANHAPATDNNAFTIGTETSNTVSLTLVEPNLVIAKQVVNGSGGPAYTITVTNNSNPNATAFDVVINDPLPPCIGTTGTPQFSAPVGSGPGGAFPTFTLQKLLPGQSASITFTGVLKCKDCAQLTNTATVTWTSEPGPQGTAAASPGSSCASNGERCGSGGPLNTYKASASASLCGKVCGVKYADLNGNGTQDPNDPALAGWPIGAGGTSTTTDASGHYCITLLPGSYTVSEGTLSGWIPTNNSSASVTVAMNMTTTHDFVNKPECHVQICGRKTTSNGQGVNGWTITATPPSGPVITATTATMAGVSGSYCMTLFGGTYTIMEAPRIGWLQAAPQGGSYTVNVNCSNSPPVTGVNNANQVDFVNDNICVNTHCKSGLHCVVGPSNLPQCVLPDQ